MNAVIYARYSSDSRREESIEGQLRPKSRHIIKDSAKELFEIVLVWKPDRLSCDRYDSVHYKHILKKNSVKVVSAKEHISECPEGIIPKAMPEGYAELSEKIHPGFSYAAIAEMSGPAGTASRAERRRYERLH